MRRPPATFVVLAWNAWGATRACLDSLRPTLGVHDQVVVVDNGSTDATASQLRNFPWAHVVTNEENRGFAAGCNQGAAAAHNPVLVFLNNDTVLAGKWIDPLVAPLADETVGATGPRSNFVSGPQMVVEAEYPRGDSAAMRRFARSWAQDHRGRTTDAERLVGFCLAVRRDVFEQVGGFDESYGIGGFEDDDLGRRILATGRRLVIAHESFVHHDGHRTFDANGLDWFAEQESNRSRFEQRHAAPAGGGGPLVSACLITKDESVNIRACLASLDGLADEVVVYDTGSTDDTVSIARDLGATIVEGYWDDDFSRARNAALANCRGQWIAWLDADETLVAEDVGALRDLLARADPGVDGFSVPIDNLTGTGAGATFVHSACRLFRRSACEWVGRLHEQVARRADHIGIRQEDQGLARIHHTGYLESVMAQRNKVERNLRLAAAEVEESAGWEKGFSLTSLARSYLTAGRFDESFEHSRRALDNSDNPIVRRLALRTAAESLFGLARLDEALAWTDRLRAESDRPVLADVLEGRIRLARGEFASALGLLDRVGDGAADDDGFEHSSHMYASHRAEALAGLGRPGEAADALLVGLFDHGVLDAHLGNVVEFLEHAGRPLTELARAIPTEKTTIFFAQVLQLRPGTADAVLEACLECHDDQRAVLAAAATVARSLSTERALVWSARLRGAGYGEACPLLAGTAVDCSPVDRARAAAVALAAFGDERARPAFLAAVDDCSPTELETVLEEAAAICPDIVPAPHRTPTAAQGNPSAREPGSPDVSAGSEVTGVPDGSGPGTPRVSIVIPCFDHAELTLGCLRSVAAHTSIAHEVVLIDNGSSDATRELADLADDHFRVVRNEENVGFGPACNQGAALSRGEYVLFLNNDTEVLAGWLEPLVAALDEDADRGAVQPKLVYPDGRLNDAGGLVFAGGEPWVYGKGDPDPGAPEFDCRRAPDYASGACLLVRRSAFEEVGGFDDRYAPAYFEDTDLSFALRDAGWAVLYEPASTVIHVEGGTAGTDVSTGLKRYQVRNAARFAEKWADELVHRPALDPARISEWAHRPQGGFGPGERRGDGPVGSAWQAAVSGAAEAKTILVIDPFMPAFDRAAGSLRLFHLLRSLREAGHAVTFLPLAGGDRRYARAVGEFGVLCYGIDEAGAMARGLTSGERYNPWVVEIQRARMFDVVIMSPWTTGDLLLAQVRAEAPDSLIVLDTIDVHYRRLRRAAELTGDAAGLRAAAEEKDHELAVYRDVDRIVCVTDDDAEAVRGEIPDIDDVIVPCVHEPADPGPGFDERIGALFVGNFNHPPNGDAVLWWKQEIAPKLSATAPAVGLTVIGNDPAGLAASMAGAGVDVTGAVPSTLPYLHRARVSVAPLRYGAGMKGKVGEALAAGLPLVATTVAVEGMGLVDGEHVLVADTAEEFAAAVELLHTDRALWERLRRAGRAHLERQLGVDRMREQLPALLAPSTRAGPARNRQARRQEQRRRQSTGRSPVPSPGRPPRRSPADGNHRGRPTGSTGSTEPTEPSPERPAPPAPTSTRSTAPTSPPSIALAVNTRNEEGRIADTIESCAGFDELVVADMASTDATVAIARSAGARILELPHAGYCEPGRQPLVDAVTSDWVLVLDADERLRPGDIDELRALAARTPVEVSAYRIPRVTMLGSEVVAGTGWGADVERHPRFFRRGQVAWPATIHAVPTFSGALVELPAGTAVHILHQNFDHVEHAFDTFNRYSGIEAVERVATARRSTWRDAITEAVGEFAARYEPETDGGVSFALAFGLFAYRMGVHVKTMEATGDLRHAPMPRASSLAAAWNAFGDALERAEVGADRAEIGRHLAAGRQAEAAAALAALIDMWGERPDVLVEAAVCAAAAGSLTDAADLCRRALAIDPAHAEAKTTGLGVDVAAGQRPPVTHVVVGPGLAPERGELVAGPTGQAGVDLVAPIDALPFAPASLERIRLAHATVGTLATGDRDRVITHLRGLLGPGGTIEVVEAPPVTTAEGLAAAVRAAGMVPRVVGGTLVAGLAPPGGFHEEWYPDAQLGELCRLLHDTLESGITGSFVEVGCWEGRSTVALARVLEGTGHHLHAVDWWLGNIDEGDAHATVSALAERDVFATFSANVAPYGCVEVHRRDGRDFLAEFAPGGPIAFIHLDAGHTYGSTKGLIDLALPHLAPGGVMCGDDFENSHAGRHDLGGGVEGAVRDAFRGHGRNIGNLWYYRRPTVDDPAWWTALPTAAHVALPLPR